MCYLNFRPAKTSKENIKNLSGNLSKESTTKKGLTGILWNFSGSIIQILFQLVVIGILARLLTPKEFGVVAVIMIFVNFSNLFSQMGIGSALIQLPKITRRHIAMAYSLSVVIGFAIGLIFYLFAPMASRFFDLEYAVHAFSFFALFLPLNSFNSIGNALLTRNFQFSLLVKCGITGYVLGTGITSIILAYLDFGYWSLIIGQFTSLLISFCLMVYFQRPIFTLKIVKKELYDLLFFGSGHTLGSVFNFFAENADNIIVGKYLGTISMGIYSKAFQLLAIPAKFFGSIFDKVLFPVLSQKQNETKKLASFYLLSNSICFGILIPISVLVFINSELLVNLLLGSQWSMVVLPMQILILGLAFRFGTKINKSYLKALGLVYRGAYYQFIFASIMLISCYLGAVWYGLPGVAIGVFIATVLNYFQVTYRLFLNLKFSLNNFSLILIKTILLNFPFLLISFGLYNFKVTSTLVPFLLSLFIYVPVITFVFFSDKYIIFNDENQSMINQIIKELPSGIKNVLFKIKFLKDYYEY